MERSKRVREVISLNEKKRDRKQGNVTKSFLSRPPHGGSSPEI
jgi:hypothetical protein